MNRSGRTGKKYFSDMFSKEEKERYSRHLALDDFTEDHQLKLRQAKVLVVGAGGLGSPLLQYLAAAGVGTIGILDGDNVELSNLQRQILFNPADLGKNKAVVSAERLALFNPNITVVPYAFRLDVENACALVRQYHLIVDGTDNFHTRYLINDACMLESKPWVFGAILRYEGQLTVFNYLGGPSYRCLFPEAPESIPTCSEAGVMGTLTGVVGTLMANEVMKCITGIGEVLSGRFLCFDGRSSRFTEFTFEPDPFQKRIEKITEVNPGCMTSDIDHNEFFALQAHPSCLFLDVRESHENRNELPSAINIPLDQLNTKSDLIPESAITIVFCEKGMRGKKAVEILRRKGRTGRIVNLRGGISQIRMIDEKVS